MRQVLDIAGSVASAPLNASVASTFSAITTQIISLQSIMHITAGVLLMRMGLAAARGYGYGHVKFVEGDNRFNPKNYWDKSKNLTAGSEDYKALQNKGFMTLDMIAGGLSACALAMAYSGLVYENPISKYSTPLVLLAFGLWNATSIKNYLMATPAAIKDTACKIVYEQAANPVAAAKIRYFNQGKDEVAGALKKEIAKLGTDEEHAYIRGDDVNGVRPHCISTKTLANIVNTTFAGAVLKVEPDNTLSIC